MECIIYIYICIYIYIINEQNEKCLSENEACRVISPTKKLDLTAEKDDK